MRVGTTAAFEALKVASTSPEGPKARISIRPTKAAAPESLRALKAVAVLQMPISCVVVSVAGQALASSPGQTEKVGRGRLVIFAGRPIAETRAGLAATSRGMFTEITEATASEGMASLVAVGPATTVASPATTSEVSTAVAKVIMAGA